MQRREDAASNAIHTVW